MLRPVVMIILLSSAAQATIIDVSSEYRRDALDAEETTSEFYREKIMIEAGEAVSAGVAVSYKPKAKELSHTWNVQAGGMSSPVTFIAGNFYAQEGSGLLYGKLKPYNPDPFDVESQLSEQKGFSPCSSSNPSYAFCGGGLSLFGGAKNDPSFILSAALSRCVRYVTADAQHGDSTDVSFSTILSHCEKKYPYETAVVCRTMAGSLVFVPCDYLRCETAAMTVSLTDESGRAMSWGRRGGDGWSAVGKTDGASVYLAYNDGALKGYLESALCRTGLKHGTGQSYENSEAVQGEVSFVSKLVCMSAKGKSISSGYSSPYFATYGSRSPADGIFLSIKMAPSEKFSAGAEGSAEKTKGVTLTEGSSQMNSREKIYFDAEIIRGCDFAVSHTAVGSSSLQREGKYQDKFRLGIGPAVLRCDAGALLQRAPSGKSEVFFSDISSRIEEQHRIRSGIRIVHTLRGNPVYAGIISTGGQPFIRASQNTQIYCFAYSYKGEIVRFDAGAAAAMSGKRCIERRLELSADGRW